MPSSERNRERRRGRVPPFRDPRPKILIVCEGRNTEKQYFDGLWKACRNSRVRVEFADDTGVPLTVVRTASKLKKEAEREAKALNDEHIKFDSVWCVYDVDDHPALSQAREMAQANGLRLAISNPSFELWLLLHHRPDPGPQHRTKIFESLCDCVAGYDKSVNYVATYHATRETAEDRASRLCRLALEAKTPGRNPTTGVYRLTRLIADRLVDEPDWVELSEAYEREKNRRRGPENPASSC